MTAPYLGGIAITDMWPGGANELLVRFSTTYTDGDYHYQIYVGRQLRGVTELLSDRIISATYEQEAVPEEITLLAVDPAEQFTDYGDDLPDRPYARVKLSLTTSGWASDTRFIEVTAGTDPGGAVDLDNVIALVPFVENGAYEIITPPFDECGTWNLEAAGRDGTFPDGNRGTALVTSEALIVYPVDLVTAEFGPRFTADVAGGILTVTFTEP